jgi:PAS domain S-box-containing protein
MSETARSAPAATPLATLSHDLMAAVRPDGRIAWANPSWRRLLGWSEEELAGMPFAELIRSGDVAAMLDGTELVLDVATRSGGKRRVVFASARADGVTYVCGRDVAQIEEIEHELRAAEERFRVITEATHEAILVADGRGRITFSNRGATTVFGWQPHELLGQPFTVLVPEQYREIWAAHLDTFLATGLDDLLGRTLAVLGSRRNGEEFPMEASLGWWERGEKGAFMGILRDVSERDATLRELELSRARYRAVVANLPNVIVALFNTDEQLLVMEGGQLARRGLARSDYEGRVLTDAIAPDALPSIGPAVRAALAGAEQEIEYATEDVEYEIHVAPLRAEEGAVIGAVAVARDVTALRHALLSLEDRAHELERSNAELAEFAYVASHDLSEPLRTITGYLQLLRRRHGDTLVEEANDYVARAIDSAGRLRTLIEDLLAYSRAGRSELPAEPVDTQSLVAAIATSVSATREPPPVIEWNGLPTIAGEARQLSQLLQNLISNAIKFVPEGTIPTIVVSAKRDGVWWRFAVDDNGIGIDAQDAERIFGMFQRLHTREHYPGTGIGLAIARKVVENHGGRIWAEPRPDGGTRMAFTLPAEEG